VNVINKISYRRSQGPSKARGP